MGRRAPTQVIRLSGRDPALVRTPCVGEWLTFATIVWLEGPDGDKYLPISTVQRTERDAHARAESTDEAPVGPLTAFDVANIRVFADGKLYSRIADRHGNAIRDPNVDVADGDDCESACGALFDDDEEWPW